MPPLLTFVARLSDGLPLVASFAQTSFNLDVQKKQAKDILRNLNSNGRSVSKMSIETTDQKIFHYLIVRILYHNSEYYWHKIMQIIIF